MRTFLKFAFLGVGLFLLGASAFLFLVPLDQREVAEKLASYHFGRPIKIGALQIQYGNPLIFDLRDVHMANKPWGSDPDFLRFSHAAGSLNPAALLKGTLEFNNLVLDDAELLLERNAKGVGNWKPGNTDENYSPHPDNPSDAARSRRSMPTIFSLALHRGHIRFITSSGTPLQIDLNDLDLSARNLDQPLVLSVDGAYNQHPLQINIAASSFQDLHDTGKPFNAEIKVKGGDGLITLNTQMKDPINFDDLEGTLHMTTKNLGAMVNIFGENFSAALPAQLDGLLKRENDKWNLNKVEGEIDGNRFGGNINLLEGARHSPDNVQLNINFENLNADNLWTKTREQNGSDRFSLLHANNHPDPLFDADLTIERLRFDAINAAHLKAHIRSSPGAKSIDDLSLSLMDGKAEGSVQSRATPEGNKMSVDAALVNIDAEQLTRLGGITSKALTGKTEAHLRLSGIAESFDDLASHGDGEAIFFIRNGLIKKNIIREASLDVGALFSGGKEMTPLSCLLIVSTSENGIALLSPLYIKTRDGNLFGGGTVNFRDHTLNVAFKTQPDKTGDLALDVPFQVKGSFNAPHIWFGSKNQINQLEEEAPVNRDELSPAFKSLVEKSACL